MSAEPPPVPPVFGDPSVVKAENRSAVGKGILFGCGGCAVVLLGIAAVAAAIIFISFTGLASSEAVAAATAKVAASPRIQETLGTPIEREWLTMGSVETSNGDSSADVRIPIKGPKGGAKIHAVGYKRQGGQWVFTVLEVTITSTAERINLLPAMAAKTGGRP